MKLNTEPISYWTFFLRSEEIKKIAKNSIITSQFMRLLQTPARAFVQTRVHYVSCFLVRMTLQMIKRLDDYYNSNPKYDNYDDVTVDDYDDDIYNDDEDNTRKDSDKK